MTLIKYKLWILKGHNRFSYLWKFEPNTPNGFSSKNSKFYRQFTALTFLPPSNCWYFLQYFACKELKIVQISQLNWALSTFEFNSYLRPRLLWVQSYANEEKCEQWRQQRFAYSGLRGPPKRRSWIPLLFHLLITNSSNHLQLFLLTCVTFKVFPQRSLIYHMRYSFAFVSKL